jgi:hypothetical protein
MMGIAFEGRCLVSYHVSNVAFSKARSGHMQDARTQNQLSNSSECNAADGRLSPCPAGVTQRAQYGVAALDKGTPFSAACALSWALCVALNTTFDA